MYIYMRQLSADSTTRSKKQTRRGHSENLTLRVRTVDWLTQSLYDTDALPHQNKASPHFTMWHFKLYANGT